MASGDNENLAESYARLQRGLLRVAFSYRGHSPDFDEHLKKLGRAIRSGSDPDTLRELIDKTVSRIVAIVDVGGGEDRAALERFVRLLDVTHDEKTRLLSQVHDAKLDAEHLVDGLARALNPVLSRSSAAADAASKPPRELLAAIRTLIGRLPVQPAAEGRLRQQIDAVEHASALDLDALEKLLRELAQSVPAERPPPSTPNPGTGEKEAAGEAEIAAQAAGLLHLLVERIPFPASVDQEISSIRRNLSTLTDPEDLRATTLELAELIADIKHSAQREISELGAFLKRITDDLLGLHNNLHKSTDAHAKTMVESRELNDAIGEHVSQMRAGFSESGSLENLKAVLDGHLGEIGERLDTFTSNQTSRHEEAERSMEKLQARVNELEQEASELRETLATQQEQAIIDPLTRVPNRLGFEQYLEDELARWQRYGNPLSLAVIDIDFFKKINDGFGHAAGDKVLVAVAQQVKETVRKTDRVCRFGGEEFIVLLPETDLEAAFRAMDKVRDLIQDCHFQYKEDKVPVTVSCGVAQFGEGDAFDSVFERADAALYRAKQAGRNRCVRDGAEPAEAAAIPA